MYKSYIILASPGECKNCVYIELLNLLQFVVDLQNIHKVHVQNIIRTRLITDWQHDVSHLPHRNLCSSEQPNNKVLNRGRDDCVVVQVNKWLSTVTTTLHINLMYEQRACFDNPQMNGYRHSTLLITWRFCFQLDWCH